MTRQKTASESPSFESALAEIETIVGRLESGKLTLDESLAAYRRGAELLKICQSQLADAERQVLVLEDSSLRPLDGVNPDGDEPR
jgi:exodeoxyribonuclease VII small subunit